MINNQTLNIVNIVLIILIIIIILFSKNSDKFINIASNLTPINNNNKLPDNLPQYYIMALNKSVILSSSNVKTISYSELKQNPIYNNINTITELVYFLQINNLKLI